MSNKVVMETRAEVGEYDSEIVLNARGSFCVYYSKGSEIHRMLNTKDKERFRITIERVKK